MCVGGVHPSLTTKPFWVDNLDRCVLIKSTLDSFAFSFLTHRIDTLRGPRLNLDNYERSLGLFVAVYKCRAPPPPPPTT